ncbi:hypothetical protein ACCT30_26800, partial [Rhizobium ruizarguesonis]
ALQGLPPRWVGEYDRNGGHIGIRKCHRGKILAKISSTMSFSWMNCGQKNTTYPAAVRLAANWPRPTSARPFPNCLLNGMAF